MEQNRSNKREYFVYEHVTPSNKVYIGITNQNPERRWRNGEGYKPRESRETPFWRAIKKYGWDNIRHIVVAEGLTKNEACELEKNLIALFRTNDRRYGYNVCSGGDVPMYDCSDEIREHMRESAFKKWKRPEYVESHTGENHWTHKKGYSQKSIDAMKKANIGIKRTPKQIEFLREKGKHQKKYFGRDNKTSKAVICLSLDGEEIAHYGGMCEAARKTCATFQGISLVCRGKQKTAGGYLWRYE